MLFHFKHFFVQQSNSALKVGTDAMVLGASLNVKNAKRILDIGTGTGVLSLMTAQKNQNATITAIEIDSESCLDAKCNFENSQWSNRLHLIQSDFLTHAFTEKFDAIVSNPPFYQNSLHNPDQQLAVAKHNEFLPMDLLLKKVATLLTDTGTFSLIFPFQDRDEVAKKALSIGFFIRKDITVNGKPETPVRTILELSLEKVNEVEYQSFDIRKADGTYSEEYRELTIDFHGKKI